MWTQSSYFGYRNRNELPLISSWLPLSNHIYTRSCDLIKVSDRISKGD